MCIDIDMVGDMQRNGVDKDSRQGLTKRLSESEGE